MNAQGPLPGRAALAAALLLLTVAPIPTAASCAAPSQEQTAQPSPPQDSPRASRQHEPATTPRRDLTDDERRGGHTIAGHVGLSDNELRARLRRERRIRAASTYTDLDTAERVVGTTLAREANRLRAWLARPAPRPNLALDYSGRRDAPIGRTLLRGRRDALPCWDAVVVLRSTGEDEYFVLTSYPERRP